MRKHLRAGFAKYPPYVWIQCEDVVQFEEGYEMLTAERHQMESLRKYLICPLKTFDYISKVEEDVRVGRKEKIARAQSLFQLYPKLSMLRCAAIEV